MTDTTPPAPRTIGEEIAELRSLRAMAMTRLRLALLAGDLGRAETWAWLGGACQVRLEGLLGLAERSGVPC